MADPFDFFLAGSTGLLVECGRALLERGHRVVGAWTAVPMDLPEPLAGMVLEGELPNALQRRDFDYLLSVAKPCLLDPEALARPRRLALNYHDGPLPRQAGRHAAPRAILHGESRHGVTWHVMVPKVDAGPILVQELFPLDPDETAFSLHLKCFEAALRTFRSLLEGLEAETLEPVAQDPGQRTFFPSTARLPQDGRLDWTRPARELSARVRSADFGPEPNDWGRCWIEGPAGPVEVTSLTVDPLPWIAPPGAILEATPEGLLVAAADRPVRLQGLHPWDGTWRPGLVLGTQPETPRSPGRVYFARPPDPVPTRFAEVAARDPERPAVLTETEEWSYSRLDRESNRYAQALLGMGLVPGDLVAVMLDRSPDMVAASLGIMKCGGTWLPLDPDTPRARLEGILAEAAPRALVARQDPGGWAWLSPERAARFPGDPCDVRIPPESLAYVIFTSGSTGEPKGVMVEHRALSWFLEVDVASHRLGPEDRVLQLCSPCFDSSVEEIFSALTCGAAVALRPPSPDPETLLDFCREHGLTVIGLFPGMFGPVLDAMESRSFPPSIRLVTTGGETVQAPDVQRWQAFFRDRGLRPPRLVNNYGLTEATIVSLACDLTERDVSSGLVPLGRPLPGTLVRVLDPDGAEAMEGELFLGGPGLARGYLGRPELTEQRFLEIRGERLYRTGDRVRRLPHGELAFLGRADRQVKVGGYRVELEEIEATLRRHPRVRECAALLLPGGLLGAWVVPGESSPPGSGAPLDPVELRSFLRRQLPAWMVPGRLEVVSDLPRSLAGKVDRQLLKTEPTVSSSGLEELVDLWREVLGRPEVHPDWDFFDQGGDSLAALRLCSRLQERHGAPVPLPTLARARTPRALAQALKRPVCFRHLQPLLRRPGETTLVFVHPLGGSTEIYRHLAGLLPGDSIGFQAMQEPEHPSVEAMAERYLEELQACLPTGPFHLLGLSLGGLVAFEMACRLARSGRRPGQVVLLDTAVPGHGRPLPCLGRSQSLQGLLRGAQRVAHHTETLVRQPAGARLAYLRCVLGRACRKGAGTIGRSLGRTGLPAVPLTAREDYAPGVYPGELLLLRARHQVPMLRVHRALGWEGHASAVRVVEIPGLHGTSLLEPPLVENVAAALGDLG